MISNSKATPPTGPEMHSLLHFLFSEYAQLSSLELSGDRTSASNDAVPAIWNTGNLMKVLPIYKEISSFHRNVDFRRKLPSLCVTTEKLKSQGLLP